MKNERKINGPNLIDSTISELGGKRTEKLLQRLDAIIPWDKLAEPIYSLYNNGNGGRPNVPVVIMLKCIMLQKWFNLSDPALEDAILDRLSFRRFLGIGLDDKGVDETTLVKFRQRLLKHNAIANLFDSTNTHLAEEGLILQEGTMVDATIISVPKGKKKKDGSHTRDKSATFTKKHGTSYHGHKAHTSTDTQGMIKDYVYDSASPHDSNHCDDFIKDEEVAVYADSAYLSKERKQNLKNRGVFCGIVEKRVRGQADLTDAQKAHNYACSKIRSIVEHPYARIKERFGHRKARYRGLRRNAQDFGFLAIAHNFMHSLCLR